MGSQKITRNADKLGKTLTTPMIFFAAIKAIIGGGVIALTGIIIANTGGGTPMAYFVASAITVLAGIPYAVLAATLPVTGGIYSWPSRLLNPTFGFLVFWFFSLTHVSLSLYALTCSDYFMNFFPGLPKTAVSFGILTLIYLANLLGAAVSARLSMILTIIMICGMLLFVGEGIGHVNPENFTTFLPNGFPAFATSVALLLFVTNGACTVAELAGEMKKPSRSIPVAIMGATSFAALIYVLVSITATGILPLSEVAHQPLTVVAKQFMSPVSFLFFTIGAGIISMLGITNVQMLWGSKSLLIACDDGWLPRSLGRVSEKTRVPYLLLTLLYIIGIIPIIFGISVTNIASAAAITFLAAQVVCIVCSWRVRKWDVYKTSSFRIPAWLHIVTASLSICILLYMIFVLFRDIDFKTLMIMAAWSICGITLIITRKKYVVTEDHSATLIRAN
jgi:APA family basic amino acid/polyamine antiporter